MKSLIIIAVICAVAYASPKYPTYGDYYRMLWDEDLRDMDSKSNKIGSGTGGK